MARVRDVPCSGGCGQLIWRGKGCLPPGQSKCQECRKLARRRQCIICGAAFTPPDKKRLTCSDGCRAERFAEVQALGAVSAAARRKPLPRCEICRVEFRPSTRGARLQRTCGRACGLELKRRVTVQCICKGCGREFARSRASSARVYCNASCRERFQAPSRPLRACEFCGAMTGFRFCSKRHSDRWWNAERAAQRGTRRCSCGAPATSSRHHKCERCRESSRRKRRLYERRRVSESFVSEPYTLAEIAARDRFMCGICRRRVAMTKVVPHPKAPTIDHIIPLSEYGDDVKANVRLAHFLCNSIRGNRGGGEQLALIG